MTQALFSAAELAAATGGVWQYAPEPEKLWSINTDSRTVQAGNCFIPIIGERFDGHDFLDKLPAGVIALAQADRQTPENLPVLKVADTTLAYQQIARFHRLKMHNLKVCAVTGSVGKTSVKEMLRAIFTYIAGEDAVVYTLGNTNNQIGVPQNLLRLTPQTRYAVIEMGTNHHGEIAPLSACALPDAAIINTIAACHLENLGDLNGVAQEKSAIFSGMTPPDATAIFPLECAGHELITQAAQPFRKMQFGSAAPADVTAEYITGSMEGSTVKLNFNAAGESFTFTWQLTGNHQAVNAAAAAAAALALNIPPADIARGLSNTTLPGQRMKSVKVNSTTWINDAYNANPHSMKSSLDCIKANHPAGKLLLVLGDMLELGNDEIAYHREIVEYVQQNFAVENTQLFLLGGRFAASCKNLDLPLPTTFFSNLPDLQDVLSRMDKRNLTIFLKSSNSIGLSKVEPC